MAVSTTFAGTDAQGARYAIDTSGQTANTGKTWASATAMGSAVAVLYSGMDPRGITTSYRVDESINGASAGGALTVGTMAALRRLKVGSDVAMTGTIAPDGTIGHVDGVEAKVKGAAAAGYRTVLVPAASAVSPGQSASSSLVDTASLSSQLGITVLPIRTVDQAIVAFTGTSMSPPDLPAPALSSDVQAVVDRQTRSAVERAASQTVSASGSDDQATATGLVSTAQQNLADGNTAGAYAAAVSALVVEHRSAALAAAQQSLSQSGPAVAGAEIIADARARALALDATIEEGAQVASSMGPAARWATLSALTWGARASSVLSAVADELEALGGQSSVDVERTAQVVGQYSVISELVLPDSLEVARATPQGTGPSKTDPTQFIDGYAQLFTTTAEANLTYYQSVLTSISANPGLHFSQPGHLYATVQKLQASNTAATSSADLSAVWSWAYFLDSTLLVAADQSYDLSGYGIGELKITAGKPEALASALESGERIAGSWAAMLAAAGFPADHAIWQGQWARALPSVLTSTDHATSGSVTALSTTWLSSSELFGIAAATGTTANP